MKKKNILIIGLGNIGKKRFKIILKNKSYDKIYLFDKIKIRSRIKKVIVLNSLKYSDIEKLDLDLAILSLNPEHSFNYASKLIKSGVNVLVEKPPFFNFDQFKKIYELSLKKKKYLFVGFNFLHDRSNAFF